MCLSLHIEVLSFEDSKWSRGCYKMECQVGKLEYFQHILLFEFKRGVKAAEAARNICTMYGDNAIGESMARKRFSRFDISDSPHSERPSGFDEDRLNTLIHNDSRQCTQELANVMNCDHSNIVRHLHSMGKVKKLGVWILHVLNQNHKNQQVAICAPLPACHRLACDQHRPFLSCIVTGDKKWCLYANIRKRKEGLSPDIRKIFQFLQLALHFLTFTAPLSLFNM